MKKYFFILNILVLACDVRAALAKEINHEIQANTYYRVKEGVIEGVYADKLQYYGLEVSKISSEIQLIVDKRINLLLKDNKNKSNVLGITFWGVWSYKTDDEEWCKLVQSPVNFEGIPAIWQSGAEKKEETKEYCLRRCPPEENPDKDEKKYHTEPQGIKFIRTKLEDIWADFYRKSKEELGLYQNLEDLTLDLVGFNFYSRYDCCDECLDVVREFKKTNIFVKPSEEIKFPQFKRITGDDPLPLEIFFRSRQSFDGSSLSYKADKSYEEWTPKSYSSDETDKHLEELHFKKLETFSFIILSTDNYDS